MIASPGTDLRRASFQAVIIVLCLSFWSTLYAQPQPCGPNPAMMPTCIEACVICDIDGYVGINNNPAMGQEPPGFCTTTAHHMQWIAFIAGTPNLTITVTPSNCEEGDGLEVGIYQSLDCNTFQLVSNCDGDIQEGQVGVFTNTIPLVVGQYYYFVMDGNRDDVCQYLINVTSGSTMVPPMPTAGPILGPDTLCASAVTSYSIPAIPGATGYHWTLDGIALPADNILDIEFSDPRKYELCVYAYNVCDTSAPACHTVTVLPAPSSAVTLSVCAGSCIEYTDTTICDPGQYTFLLSSATGCDSTVFLTVVEQSFVETDISTTICSTDSLQINGTWYHPPGMYDVTLIASSGCDSIIHLNLQGIECVIDGMLVPADVICYGDATGALSLTVDSGTPPFSYTWQNAGTGLSGTGSISSINSPLSIPGLPAGLYVITIYDSFGNTSVLSSTVHQPEPITIAFTSADYHGYGVTCYGASDGTLSVQAAGGTPGYTYQWDPLQAGNQLLNIGAGEYQLTVTDIAGCMMQASYIISDPDPVEFIVEFSDPGCMSEQSGQIEIISASGGASPYAFAINNGTYSEAVVYPGLVAGEYLVGMQDANGCSTDTMNMLTGVIIPVVLAGEDAEVDLGYSTYLNAEVEPASSIIEWSPAAGLSCIHCLDPLATPFTTTTYFLSAISPDGCETLDSLTITVRKPKDDIYIPNVFSPNGDGLNDRFTVFGGRSVKWIEQLSIFSRWGDLMLQHNTFMANDPLLGWDGTFRDQPVSPGVYTWIAEIRYLDDSMVTFSGDVTIVR